MPRKSVPACESEKSIFAKRLTEAMKESDENQTTLAKKISSQYVTIQRQTISLYMNGQSKPDTERLAAIARVLDVSADWLLGLSDERAINGDLAQAARYTGLPANSVKKLHKLSTNTDPLKASLWVIREILGEKSDDFETWVWRAAMSCCCPSMDLGEDKVAAIRHSADAKLLEIAIGKSNDRAVNIPTFDYEEVCTTAAINLIRKAAEKALTEYKSEFHKAFFNEINCK